MDKYYVFIFFSNIATTTITPLLSETTSTKVLKRINTQPHSMVKINTTAMLPLFEVYSHRKRFVKCKNNLTVKTINKSYVEHVMIFTYYTFKV